MRLSSLLTMFVFLCSSSFAAQDSRYVRMDPKNESVVIFVHGVTGDSLSTWTNSTTKAFWPELMKSDHGFDSENIYLYEYPSPKVGASYNINELAEDMRLALNSDVIARHKRVIFIVHSMGGLVVRQYLLKYRDSVNKIGFIYFYATPTTGSPMAVLASQLSRNPQLGNLKPMKVDEYLGNLQRDWLDSNTLRAIPSFCAYEVRKLYSFKIVEQESASNLCNRPLDAIDTNHIDIVKPESKKDKIYRAFKEAYLSLAPVSAPRAFRIEIQNVTQAVAMTEVRIGPDKKPIYCDAVKFTLVLANASASAPILVNAIKINADKMAAFVAPGAACKTDRFSSTPHGILEKNVFMVDLRESAVKSSFLKNKNEVVQVNDKNVLASSSSTRAITLKAGEEPLGLDFIVHSFTKDPRELSFTIDYDQDGERQIRTSSISIQK